MINLKILPVIFFIVMPGCKQGDTLVLSSYYTRLDAIPQEKWDSLVHKKIFFGHKSVGQNIIDGLYDVMRKYPAIRLDIRETADPAAFERPVFAHSLLGTNKLPISKINNFRELMENGLGNRAEIAFFKFCFVDIDHTTDLRALYASYVESVERIEKQFPDTKIVTFTVPLLSHPVGLKSRLRKLLGMMPWYDKDHIQRNTYNNMLREKFKDSLFDLAAIESRINGTVRASLSKDGRRFDVLYRGYTDDGGHLNSVGRQIAAIELLCFLVNLGER